MKTPWPGIARTVYGDHERYRQTYFTTFKGYYFSGDGALRDGQGYYQITGRVDDVINVTGHRLGTAEVEDVLVRSLFIFPYFYFETFQSVNLVGMFQVKMLHVIL